MSEPTIIMRASVAHPAADVDRALARWWRALGAQDTPHPDVFNLSALGLIVARALRKDIGQATHVIFWPDQTPIGEISVVAHDDGSAVVVISRTHDDARVDPLLARLFAQFEAALPGLLITEVKAA